MTRCGHSACALAKFHSPRHFVRLVAKQMPKIESAIPAGHVAELSIDNLLWRATNGGKSYDKVYLCCRNLSDGGIWSRCCCRRLSGATDHDDRSVRRGW